MRDDVRCFLRASDEVQFVVLRVIGRRSKTLTSELLSTLSLMAALYGLLITGFLHGGDGGLLSWVPLGVIAAGAVIVVTRALSLRVEQATGSQGKGRDVGGVR